MKVKWLIFYVVFVVTQASNYDLRVSSLPKIARHVHRIYLFFSHRLQNMFEDSGPLIQKLAEDSPEFSSELKEFTSVLFNIYNEERFVYWKEDAMAMYFGVILPLTSNQCANSANTHIGQWLSSKESALSVAIRDKLVTTTEELKNAHVYLQYVLDAIMVITEKTNEDAKVCQDKTSTNLVGCLHKMLIGYTGELDDILKNPDFTDMVNSFKQAFGNISSVSGSVKTLIESMLKDVFMEFASCVDNSYLREDNIFWVYLRPGGKLDFVKESEILNN